MRGQKISKACLLVFIFLLVACSSQPYALIETDRTVSTDPKVHATYLVTLDGKAVLTPSPYRVTPGLHTIQVGSLRTGDGNNRELQINIEPCIKYIIVAVHESNLWNIKRWEAKIARQLPIRNCKVID